MSNIRSRSQMHPSGLLCQWPAIATQRTPRWPSLGSRQVSRVPCCCHPSFGSVHAASHRAHLRVAYARNGYALVNRVWRTPKVRDANRCEFLIHDVTDNSSNSHVTIVNIDVHGVLNSGPAGGVLHFLGMWGNTKRRTHNCAMRCPICIL